MNIIIIMIPLSFLILLGGVAAFFWAVNNDQFDDMDSPGLLPMGDDVDELERASLDSTTEPAPPSQTSLSETALSETALSETTLEKQRLAAKPEDSETP